jgi:hypothetical protein
MLLKETGRMMLNIFKFIASEKQKFQKSKHRVHDVFALSQTRELVCSKKAQFSG